MAPPLGTGTRGKGSCLQDLVGWESQNQRCLKCHRWPLLPATAMGNAPRQPTSALGSVLGRTRHVKENKPRSSREKEEPFGITHLPKLLLLSLCKAAKRKSKPTA